MMSKKILQKTNIALITMPCASIKYPSVQIGTLKSILTGQGYSVDDYYLNLDFAKEIDLEAYENISNHQIPLIAEWIFAEDAFRVSGDIGLKEFESRKRKGSFLSDETAAKYEEMKANVKSWMDRVINKINWEDYSVVGFTCCYKQTVSSIALSARIKKLHPNIKIIFGGSSLEGKTGQEFSKRVDFIDCLVQGEGDEAILEIIKMIEDGKNLPKIYKSKVYVDLNKVPIPDYDHYYSEIQNEDMFNDWIDKGLGTLTYETSRGCWWGEKVQCIFCGFNQKSIKYRKRTADKVLSDLKCLTRRYSTYKIWFTDSILNEDHFKELFPKLVECDADYQYFFEVKSNLDSEKLSVLKKAGLRKVQVGIESLSPEALRIMKKGVSLLNNLEFLKWTQYFGIQPLWNFLYGLPGEKDFSYQEVMNLIPKIRHLEPPKHVIQVQLSRFSKLFEDYVEKGKKKSDYENIRYVDQYESCYPKDWALEKIASYYTADLKTGVRANTYDDVIEALNKWQKSWEGSEEDKPRLIFKKGLLHGHIVDTREGKPEVSEIDGDYFKVAQSLDGQSQNIELLTRDTGLNKERVLEVCEDLISAKFVLNISGKYLWLPISEKKCRAPKTAKNNAVRRVA